MHQAQMKIQKIHPKPFSKYDFVKSYSATAKTPKLKKEKEREAVIIADAIKDHEENLATKQDLEMLEKDLVIKITFIFGSLLTLFTILQKFIS